MNAKNVTSRRAVLKGLPAAAIVAAVPAVAVAQPPARLTALLAAYDQAHEAFSAAVDRLGEADDRLSKLPRLMVPMSLTPDGKPLSGLIEYYDDRDDDVLKAIAETHQQLRNRHCGTFAARMVPEQVDAMTAALDASEAACMREFEAVLRQRDDQRAATGVTTANEEWSRTCEAEDAASVAIMAYAPTTPEEARAKSAWLHRRAKESDFSDDELSALFRSIAGEA